jgi:hypothetical protein
MAADDQRGSAGGAGQAPIRPFLLIALAGAVYIGLNVAVTVWKSWLLAGAVLSLGMMFFWMIWPDAGDGNDPA